jgi:hypothetical protein
MGKRKSDCSPEEWAEHLEKERARRLRNIEHIRAREREYAKRPEVREKRRAQDMKPHVKAKRQAREQSPEYSAYRKEVHARLRANPAKWEEKIARQRKRRTGMLPSDIEQLLAHQGNCCAVCGRAFEGRQVRADHCHDTGSPRGLLCHHCNIIEGMMRGMEISPTDFAERLDSYLRHPPFLSLDR